MTDFTKINSSIIVRPIMTEGNSFIDSQVEDNRQLIEKWVSDFGFRIHTTNKPRALWSIDTIDDAGAIVGIGQAIGHANEIMVQARFNVDGIAARHVERLKTDELKALISNMRVQLLALNIEIEGLDIPLKAVTLSQYIYVDSLTQDVLFQRLRSVRQGLQVAITLFRESMQREKS